MVPRSSKLARDVTGAVNVLLIVLIALLMVSASTVVIMLYQGGQSEESTSDVVAVGHTISVDYIGKLTDGRVFDTSNYSIAIDDANYPKTLSFNLRSESSYTPLSFTVGEGEMISGFDNGVVGMRVGETKTVTIPPEEAYGAMDQSKLISFDLVETVPLLETHTHSSFQSEYGVSPVNGLTVTDPFYGWPVTVLECDVQADQVTVKNVPTLDEKYRIYGDGDSGWDVQVTDIDSGTDRITFEHQLDDADSDRVKGVDGSSTFYVIQVDTAGGTAVRNYNSELQGKTLVFIITVVSIVD
jgi:FKBP-type peptidyl-prolyl cis-trans isomerase 2